MMGLNGLFVALFLGSAWLFSKADAESTQMGRLLGTTNIESQGFATTSAIGRFPPWATSRMAKRSTLSSLSIRRQNLVAYLDKVAIRILEVDGKNLARRAGPLARSVKDFYASVLEMQDDRIERSIGQQAEISAAGECIAGDAGRCKSILKADLVHAEMQGPFAGPLFPGLHIQDTLVKTAGGLNVVDTEHNVVERAHLHAVAIPFPGVIAKLSASSSPHRLRTFTERQSSAMKLPNDAEETLTLVALAMRSADNPWWIIAGAAAALHCAAPVASADVDVLLSVGDARDVMPAIDVEPETNRIIHCPNLKCLGHRVCLQFRRAHGGLLANALPLLGDW
jgi:hypothetical protein